MYDEKPKGSLDVNNSLRMKKKVFLGFYLLCGFSTQFPNIISKTSTL
jgi:hypothetical protein